MHFIVSITKQLQQLPKASQGQGKKYMSQTHIFAPLPGLDLGTSSLATCCANHWAIDHGRADKLAVHHAPRRSRHQIDNLIFFVFKNEPNLLGGLVYHVISLSVRSKVVHGLAFICFSFSNVRYSDPHWTRLVRYSDVNFYSHSIQLFVNYSST